MVLSTFSRDVVGCVLCALPGFAVSGGRCCLAPVTVPWLWPAARLSGVPCGAAWCAAPRPVRSLYVLYLAFLTRWCLSPSWELAPPDLLGGCTGQVEAGRERGSWGLPLADAEAGVQSWLRVVPVRSPAMGLSLAVFSGVGLGLRVLRWYGVCDPVTDASGYPYRSYFNWDLGRCTGAASCENQHHPLRVAGRHARVLCVCACAFSPLPGQAGWPPGPVVVRFTFSYCSFVHLLCSAPSGLGLPFARRFLCLPSFLCCFFCPFL